MRSYFLLILLFIASGRIWAQDNAALQNKEQHTQFSTELREKENAVTIQSGVKIGNESADNHLSAKQLRLNEIKNRVDEIKKIDIRKLSIEERKALRKEVRELKKELKREREGTVYIYLGILAAVFITLLIVL